MRYRPMLLGLALAMIAGTTDVQATDAHSQRWNAFVDALYDLHKQQVAGKNVREETETRGYPRWPDFYDEVRYIDADNGRLLSAIQWERDNDNKVQPRDDRDRIHSIAVYIYDDQGRVIRDFSGTYLPDYKKAPTQTLIFLHAYNSGTHAFRSFDADNNLTYERCTGELNGQKVDIGLDEDAMYDAKEDPKSVMYSVQYKTCFEGIPTEAGSYLTPH
jgi:hypothetical protein